MITRRDLLSGFLAAGGAAATSVMGRIKAQDPNAEVREFSKDGAYVVLLSGAQVNPEAALSLSDWLQAQGVTAIIMIVKDPKKAIEIRHIEGRNPNEKVDLQIVRTRQIGVEAVSE